MKMFTARRYPNLFKGRLSSASFSAAITVVVFAAAIGGCSLIWDNDSHPDPVGPGDTFRLRESESVLLYNGARIHFEALISDSRCPLEVQCIWEGAVDAAIVWERGSTRIPFRFVGFVGAEGDPVLEEVVEQHTVVLERIDPYPVAEGQQDESVVALLRLMKD